MGSPVVGSAGKHVLSILCVHAQLFPSVAGVLVEAYSRRSTAADGSQAPGTEPQKQPLSAAAAAQLAAGIGSRTQACRLLSDKCVSLAHVALRLHFVAGAVRQRDLTAGCKSISKLQTAS